MASRYGILKQMQDDQLQALLESSPHALLAEGEGEKDDSRLPYYQVKPRRKGLGKLINETLKAEGQENPFHGLRFIRR